MIRTLTLALLLPVPVAAQTAFTAPAGCEVFVTIQTNSCTVSHLFRCEDDPEGYLRRANFGEEGLDYAGLIDGETQWLESFYPQGDAFETLVPDPADPMSLTDLMETGISTFDFEIENQEGERYRFVGFDQITGDPVEIDGVTLTPTEYNIRMVDQSGETIWTARGDEFIHEEWRSFLSGTGVSARTGEEEVAEDYSPIEFIFPGEDGFLSAQPKYQCGLTEMSFEVQP